jgi:hypothetical protein
MAGLGGFSLEKAAEEQRRYDMEAAAIRQERKSVSDVLKSWLAVPLDEWLLSLVGKLTLPKAV